MKKAPYGFYSTMGLLVMLLSGFTICASLAWMLWEWANGHPPSPVGPFSIAFLGGGVLPYVAGWYLFRKGKRIRNSQPKF